MSNDQHAELHQHFPSIWTAIVQEWTTTENTGPTSEYPHVSAKQRSLLRQIKALMLVNQVAVFTAPTKWAKEEIERTLAPQIRQVLDQKLGMHVIMAISEEEAGESTEESGTETQDALHHAETEGVENDFGDSGFDDEIEDFQSEDSPEAFGLPGLGDERPQTATNGSTTARDIPKNWSSLPGQRQEEEAAAEQAEQGELPVVEQQNHQAAEQHAKQQVQPTHSAQSGHPTQQSETPVFGTNGEQIQKNNPNYPHLNADYTFDRFVVGSSNQFAAAACRSVAEQPAKGFNPLFLWGESGLGKTHLLHAIAHYALELRPEMRVMYTSTEELTNDFINSIANDTREAFKRRYRSLDMLIVDDIQFLEGKESTQEEFFHTFNALHQAGKQIVLSSDRPPSRLTTLEDRLRTRFEGGLITDVTSPDLETRMAILANKAKREKTALPEDVKILIAERYDRSIRALEGALTRVIAYCSLENQEMSVNSAKIALQDILPDEVEVNPQVVIEVVAEYFDLTPDDLTGKGRSKHLVYARQIAMYLCRELTELSLPKLGASFGGRDHTTVMYAERRIRESITEDKKTFDQVQELLTRVKSRARA